MAPPTEAQVRRHHLVEIHEQPWCPPSIRDGLTDFLQSSMRGLGMFRPIIPVLQELLAASGTPRIVDLCSGGTGVWLSLLPALRSHGTDEVELVLTDKFPSDAALERVRRSGVAGMRFVPTPVDATAVPTTLPGVRTMLNSFHHFAPDTARAILQDAVHQGQPIAIFEATERRWLPILLSLGLPGLVMALAPFTRPFRASRVFWSWVVPVLPFVVTIDAVVSCLRTYTPEELTQMTSSLEGPSYIWTSGTLPLAHTPFRVTYLTGRPTPHATPRSPSSRAS